MAELYIYVLLIADWSEVEKTTNRTEERSVLMEAETQLMETGAALVGKKQMSRLPEETGVLKRGHLDCHSLIRWRRRKRVFSRRF